MKKIVKYLLVILFTIILLPKNAFAISNLNEILTDGKLVVPSVAPNGYQQYYNFIGNYLMELDNVELAYPSNCTEDYTECDIDIEYKNGTNQSLTGVKIEYAGGDSDVKTSLETFSSKFTMGQTFLVRDLEIINYLSNINTTDSFEEIRNTMINYSGEFRTLMDNTNIDLSLVTPTGMGMAGILYEAHLGDAVLSYNGTRYVATNALGVRVEHIIYVEDGTTDLKKAAQDRIDNYIGSGKFTVSDGGTINSLYSAEPDLKDEDFGELDIDPSTVENYYTLSYGSSSIPIIIIPDSSKMSTPTYLSKDLNTNITVSSDNKTIPLDTKISATKLTSGDAYDKIIKVLDVKENETYDLKLFSKTINENITKLDNGKFLVKLPVPSTLSGKDLMVYYVKEDGTIEKHEVKVTGDFVEFETDHFSVYTLAENKTETTTTETATEEKRINNPATNDNIGIYIILSTVTLLGSTVTFKRLRKTN